MSNQWTGDQLQAIEGRDRRMLVAAAAGAGKTAVLVERIIRRVTDPADPVDIDHLLVVTFTNAAAAEMRERIGLALTRALELSPDSVLLQRQLALLQRASISTIHSFCLEIARQHFYRLDLDPVFRVADETEAALLQLDVLEELFERRFSDGDEDFARLADCYGGRQDDTGLQELVLELYRFSRSTPRPLEWLRGFTGLYHLDGAVDVDSLPWFQVLRQALGNELAGISSLLEQALQATGRPGGPAPYRDTLQEDITLVEGLRTACAAGWPDLYRQFGTLALPKLKSCKKEDADEEQKKAVQKMRNTAKDWLQRIRQRYFSRPPDRLLDDLRLMAPLLDKLAGLVEEFAEDYRRAKVERGLVDFSDLEHYALQVLAAEPDPVSPDAKWAPSPVALELRSRFAEVLVDEYQDINAVQETIIGLLTGGETGPNLFMVGDVKQSIYRFRLAEPGLFMEKYHRFAVDGPGMGRLITLAQNFRSRGPVLDAVNFVFRQVMSPAVGEIDYDAKAELVCGASYPALPAVVLEKVELHLLETERDAQSLPDGDPPDEGDGDQEPGEPLLEEELDALQAEARTVGQRIMGLLDDGYPVFNRERGQYRPLTYRDVVVLLRATTGRANIFVEEFGKLGIPAYAELNTGYFEATEVETVLALLKIIDNPRQDVPLAAVLRSPLAGFTSEDLALIRQCAEKGEFYDAVVMASQEGPEDLASRLAEFLRSLAEWRTRARQISLPDLVWSLYRDTGFYDFVGGLPGGGQRQANLRALYSRARQYEATSYRGLFRFLRFIDRIRGNRGDLGTARALGENENLVRIMSIHKSKGLEFPVVIVAGLGKQFNLTDLNKGMLMHRELGLGPQLVDPERRIAYPTVAKLAVREKLKAEALAEEMRVLYVAMTRAREKLILVGSVRKLRENCVRWCAAAGLRGKQLPAWLTSCAVRCLDWLVPAVARHRDGEPLRSFAGVSDAPPADLAGDVSRWSVYITACYARQGEIQQLPADDKLKRVRGLEPVPVSGPRAGAVQACLDWHYPYPNLEGFPARETVTGILKRALPPGDAKQQETNARDFAGSMAARPVFVQKRDKLTAAERGQALHTVMQLLDLRRPLDRNGIAQQMALMVEREQLSAEQAAAVNPGSIAGFFRCSLGQRLLACRRVYRELPFTLALPAHLLDYGQGRDVGHGETVLVQGIIDCLAEEGDGLLLIDYKTDRYLPGELTAVAERYQRQLGFYAHAVRVITGRSLTGGYLYFFNRGDTVALDCSKTFSEF